MVKNIQPQKLSVLEKVSIKLTNWVGTPGSIVVHTLLFIGIFSLGFFGFTIDKILLILTTAVSLEAIYLSIFIQMTVNRQGESIEDIEEDIEDIQEDVEDLSEDVEDIGEDIDKIQDEVPPARKVQVRENKNIPVSSQGKLSKIIHGISDLASKNLL